MSKYNEINFGKEYIEMLAEGSKKYGNPTMLGEEATKSDRPSPILDAIAEYESKIGTSAAKIEDEIKKAVQTGKYNLGTNIEMFQPGRKLSTELHKYEVKGSRTEKRYANRGEYSYISDDGTTRLKITASWDSSD